MTNYKKLYSVLFNAITDALEQQSEGNYEYAALILRTAQRQTEEMFLAEDVKPATIHHISELRDKH
ncbi:MAG: hypothetical protein Q4A39_04235 [Eubacteriales bacterium]|nr:hypothetical protein [Eubacteriales bacterium]